LFETEKKKEKTDALPISPCGDTLFVDAVRVQRLLAKNQLEKQKMVTLHDFACHPCAGAMLIFSV